MKKHVFFLLTIVPFLLFGQKDFTEEWSDLFSYNNVKDFTLVGDEIYAITENSMFIYNIEKESIEKFSSVNGLSADITSSIYFDEKSQSILVGYENGMIDLITEEDQVIPITGLQENRILLNKKIRGFYVNETGYAFGDFGIIELNIEKREIGDSFKLANSGTPQSVQSLVDYNDVLYAATSSGLYSVDISEDSKLDPIKFENWTVVKLGNVSNLVLKDDVLYFSVNKDIYEIAELNTIGEINTATDIKTTIKDLDQKIVVSVSNEIENIKLSENGSLIVTTAKVVDIYETSPYLLAQKVDLDLAETHNFSTKKAIVKDENIFVSTTQFGVLKAKLTQTTSFTEIHPDGPNRNDMFSITARDNNIWMSYGGYNVSTNFSGRNLGISGFYNNKWYNIPHADLNIRDITKIEINPEDPKKIYIASYFNGVVLAEFQVVDEGGEWNNVGRIGPSNAITSYLTIDNNDKLWVSSIFNENHEFISRYNFKNNVRETKVGFSDFYNEDDIRILKMYVAKDGTIFCGTRRNGMVVFKEEYDQSLGELHVNNKINVLNISSTQGALPSANVRAVVADDNNRVWIGTSVGLVVYDDYDNLFNDSKQPAKTIVFEENGVLRELLGSTKINDIIIDDLGAKWIATDGAGVFHVSSDGQKTFNIFNTSSSPLISNTITDLELDTSTGSIYMVSDKGTMSYTPKKSDLEIFGEKLTDVVAFPNPAIRNRVGHGKITIVAKDGKGIPDGTNVKILDVSGKLVFETNVFVEPSEIGEVIWNKKNLRGNLVTSGVYIVLLSNEDGAENKTIKIAIVN